MKKEKIFFYILSFVLLNDNFLYETEGNNIQKEIQNTEKKEKSLKNIFKTFAETYIFTKENQIFKQNKYGVFFTYGVSVNKNKKGTLIDITDIAGKIYENDTDFIEYNT